MGQYLNTNGRVTEPRHHRCTLGIQGHAALTGAVQLRGERSAISTVRVEEPACHLRGRNDACESMKIGLDYA